MAKFLAELLGCTLPSKGASPMFESKSHSRVGLKSSTKQKTTIFSTLASEKSLSDCKKEQQWKLSMYSRSIPPVCFTSPLIEKPVGKVRMNPFLLNSMIVFWLLSLLLLSYLGEIIKQIS
uniref:RasGEF domain family member 1B n=1 Tax=Suricata suricatta TaxID=37032 RepID=A0A673V2M3_SURSU